MMARQTTYTLPAAAILIALAVGLVRNGQAQEETAKPAALRSITIENGRPVFNIPPDSRLARNEHPRCLLTMEDLEGVKKRLADPRIARELEVIKTRSLGDRPWILEQALARPNLRIAAGRRRQDPFGQPRTGCLRTVRGPEVRTVGPPRN